MALLDRIAGYDSIQELDAAREDRYWDALACAVEGRDYGACYLLGYAMEMALKVAYFRMQRLREDVDLRDALEGAFQMARARGIRESRGRILHDVRFWAQSLITDRAQRGRPLSSELRSPLLYFAELVDDNWSVEMRYRRSVDASDETHTILRALDRIRANHRALWS